MELWHLRSAWACLGNSELPIGTVRNYRLTRLKVELRAVQMHRNYVRLERHQARDAANFRIGFTLRPCRQTCVTDIVVAAQPFVWTEGLMLHERQRGLIDVGARNVPARRKAGLVQDDRPLGIANDAVMMANHEVA